MSNNMEKKFTKAIAFGTAGKVFAGMNPDEVLDTVIVTVEGKEVPMEITAGMMAEKLFKEVESIQKKASSGKLNPVQLANRHLGEVVLNFLRENVGKRYTCTQLMKEVPGLPEEITNAKMTSIIYQETVKPFVKRTEDKGRAYFEYLTEDAETEE